VAVSVIRELKEANIVDGSNTEQVVASKKLLVFDPLAVDAQFPRTILFFCRIRWHADAGNPRGLFQGDLSKRPRSCYAYKHIVATSMAICADFRGFRSIPRMEQWNRTGCHISNFESL
jgi:hypothetical protein